MASLKREEIKVTRKGKMSPWVGWLIFALVIVLVVVFVGGCAAKNGGIGFTAVGIETNTDGDQPEDISTENCPDDGVGTINVKLEDDGATSETFVSGSTLFAINMDADDGNGIREQSVPTYSSAWSKLNLTCGKNYKVHAVAQQAVSGSAESDNIALDEDQEYLRLHTKQISKMTIKVKDLTGDDWESIFADANSTGTNSTTGVDFNQTNIYESTAAADIAVGSDGYLDLRIDLKSATNAKTANDQGMKGSKDVTRLDLKNYFCVDLNGATNGQEWDTNSVTIDVNGGKALPNVFSTIDSKSKEYVDLQKAEYCADIGDIDDDWKTINFYVKAKAGFDPDATDDDILIYVLGEGRYNSSLNSDEITKGIYTDATTQRGVLFSLTGEYPKGTIMIS